MCSTSTPTSRPIVTAQAIRPSVCEMLKRRSGAPAGAMRGSPAARARRSMNCQSRGRDRGVARQHRPHQRARDHETRVASRSNTNAPCARARPPTAARDTRRAGRERAAFVGAGRRSTCTRSTVIGRQHRYARRAAPLRTTVDTRRRRPPRRTARPMPICAPCCLHEVGGALAIQHREIALAEIADAAADHDRGAEPPRRHRAPRRPAARTA